MRRKPGLLHPGGCYFCQRDQDLTHGLCDFCLDQVAYRPREVTRPGWGLDGAYACLAYGGLISKHFYKFKYDHGAYLAQVFGSMMAQALLDLGLHRDLDYMTLVPMEGARKRRRGYNQAELLAQAIGGLIDLPPHDLLSVRTSHRSQVGLRGRQRAKNIAHSLEAEGDLTGARVLVIDDVVTTGATLKEACRALKEAGALEVRGLVLAESGL